MADDAPVAVVGLLGGRPVGDAATAALASAALVAGGRDQLAAVADLLPPGARTVVVGAGLGALDAGRRRPRARRCVLASGDPGFFGIVRALAARWAGATGWSCTRRRRRSPSPSPASACRGTTPSSAPATPATSRGWRPTWPGPRWPRSSPGPTPRPRRWAPPSSPSAPTTGWWWWPPAWASRARWSPAAPTWPTSPPAASTTGRSWCWPTRRPPPKAAATLGGRPVAAFAHRASMITKPEVRSVVLGKLDLPAGACCGTSAPAAGASPSRRPWPPPACG